MAKKASAAIPGAPRNAASPWRRGPACDTRRAKASYLKYEAQGTRMRPPETETMSTTNKYMALDEAVLAAIKAGKSTFTAIWPAVSEEVHAIATSRGEDRTLDARLQALRKRGLIRFAKGRWEVVA